MSIDLSAPEVQEAIQAAVEKATAPLLAKRDELLREVKEARKGKQIDPADLDKLESEVDRLKGELSEAQKLAKVATRESEGAKKALADAEGFTTRLLVDQGLTEALSGAGVTNPAHLKAVKSMLAGQVQVVADGDQKVAKVGDKALKEYVTEWAKGEEGKFFVAAPANSGGSANPGNGAPGAKTMTRSQFDQASHSARAEFAKAGGKVVEG